MRVIPRSSFTTTRWRNGGGITHEAVREPAGAAGFLWRMSVAEIAASGPFSDFAGYRRIMVLLRGNGVELRFAGGGGRTLREVGDLAEFDGALHTDCELLDGPCADLNLIVSTSLDHVDAQVVALPAPVELPLDARATLAAFCIRGAVLLDQGGGGAALEPWDLATATGEAGAVSLRAAAGAAGGALAFVARLAPPTTPPPRETP